MKLDMICKKRWIFLLAIGLLFAAPFLTGALSYSCKEKCCSSCCDSNCAGNQTAFDLLVCCKISYKNDLFELSNLPLSNTITSSPASLLALANTLNLQETNNQPEFAGCTIPYDTKQPLFLLYSTYLI
jgi:hypothetical protein